MNENPAILANVNEQDLPALFRSADRASALAKQRYIRLVACDLVLAVTAGVFGSFALANDNARIVLGIAAAVAIAAGTILTILISALRLEEQWYGARAIAESVKTLTWKYMTGADPFALSLGGRTADNNFATTLGAVLAERKRLAWHSGGDLSAGDQITATMRRVRAGTLDLRKRLYIDNRVQDQRRWYAARSHGNYSSRQWWFIAVIICQLAVLGSAVRLVTKPGATLDLTAALAALAVSILAWINVKKFQELGQSYGLAAHELGLVAVKAEYVTTDQELSEFVSDAESAMSREHTMWVARREEIG